MLTNKEKIKLLEVAISLAQTERNSSAGLYDCTKKDHDEYWNAQIGYFTEFKAEFELADQL